MRARSGKTCSIILICAIFTFCTGCTRLMYQPSDTMYARNQDTLAGMREEVFFPSMDGTRLAGWFFKSARESHLGTVVQFHGNAQNMTAHFASLVWLRDEGYDFFTFDYRGYGISEGHPTEEGLNQDALASIRYVIGRAPPSPDGKPDIILYGQSLGGAVLLRAFEELRQSERSRIRALVVESSFYDYHEIARDLLSRSWLTFIFQPLAYLLVSDAYTPENAISKVSPTPLLVIHGDNDPIIPLRFGKKIFSLAREPKRWIEVPQCGHVEAMFVDHGRYRKQVLEFIASSNSQVK